MLKNKTLNQKNKNNMVGKSVQSYNVKALKPDKNIHNLI
jgi:hypothetical protein